jgi:hypothetical protein
MNPIPPALPFPQNPPVAPTPPEPKPINTPWGGYLPGSIGN